MNQYNDYIIIQIYKKSFHSSTNMPDLKSVVVKDMYNAPGQQFFLGTLWAYAQSVPRKAVDLV